MDSGFATSRTRTARSKRATTSSLTTVRSFPSPACTSVDLFVPDATYFPNRAAKIYFRPPLVAGAHLTFAPVASFDAANATGKAQGPTSVEPTSTFDNLKEKLVAALPSSGTSRDVEIGSIGILHPTVLKAYELDFPCSAMEFDVDPFL